MLVAVARCIGGERRTDEVLMVFLQWLNGVVADYGFRILVSDAMMEEMISLTGGDEDECAATMEVDDNGLCSDEDDGGGTTWLTTTLARKTSSGEGEEEGNRTAEGGEATERGRAVKKKEDTEQLKHGSRSVEDFPIQHLI
ncbi:hypothetical protein LR48_Vigan06g135300 [Vigna angularis]|uniref:Uncharacterized protein n=1 Tax=Phaseolus angularis TaxID=3914 RepID=A0A0L9UTZ2_PHAAN|nr:hypothetical protein LR48_Vigan06g135300 [Vigna angularis]